MSFLESQSAKISQLVDKNISKNESVIKQVMGMNKNLKELT